MQKKKSSKRIYQVFWILSVVSIILLGIYILTNNPSKDKMPLPVTENCTVEINDVVYSGINLSNFSFDVLNRGDTVTIKATLPDKQISHPVLLLTTVHTTVDIFLDGESIYSYGQDLKAKNKMVGYGFNFVKLPEHYEGKSLVILLEVCEDDAFSSIDPITLQPASDVDMNLLRGKVLPTIIEVFLFYLGFTICTVLFFIWEGKTDNFSLFWIGVLSMIMSFYLLCNSKVIQLLVQDIKTLSYLEYISLYLLPIPILCFYYYINVSKRIKFITVIMLIIECSFVTISLLLNEFNVLHLPNVLRIYHIMCIIMLIFVILSLLIQRIIYKDKTNRLIIIGFVVMVLFMFANIVLFNIIKYIRILNGSTVFQIAPVGVLLFICALIANVYANWKKSSYKIAEQKAMEKLAYTDILTGINNRARCEEKLKELEEERNPIAIVSLDLNNFKQINYTFGHRIGDTFLQTFSTTLSEVFPNNFYGRIGGDEFIIILNTINATNVIGKMQDLREALLTKAKESNQIPLSFAYGWAIRSEDINTDRSIYELYDMADKQMYENKRQQRPEGISTDNPV